MIVQGAAARPNRRAYEAMILETQPERVHDIQDRRVQVTGMLIVLGVVLAWSLLCAGLGALAVLFVGRP